LEKAKRAAAGDDSDDEESGGADDEDKEDDKAFHIQHARVQIGKPQAFDLGVVPQVNRQFLTEFVSDTGAGDNAFLLLDADAKRWIGWDSAAATEKLKDVYIMLDGDDIHFSGYGASAEEAAARKDGVQGPGDILALLHDPAAGLMEDLFTVIKHATIPELIMGLVSAVALWAVFLAVDKTGRHKLAFGLSCVFFVLYLFYVSTAAWVTAISAVGLA